MSHNKEFQAEKIKLNPLSAYLIFYTSSGSAQKKPEFNTVS